MRNRIGTSLGLALALALAGVLAAQAGEGARQRKVASSPLLRAPSFTLSGRCSGPLDGEIRIDGVGYRLDPGASIYEIGRGAVPAGTSYSDRVVTVSGLKLRNTLVVYSVLVRPAAGVGANDAIRVRERSSAE